ncbi:hypothetical protein KCU93_g9439, partial [Aureobasidium melanogenum]
MAVGSWKKKEEYPKVALYTGWVSVLTGLLVHVLPLAACVTLIYLNLSSYLVGAHVSSLTFQFLAKFLELLAQASLGSAVFVYLRALYTGSESVPFGALFAGLQITSVSYLWSLEFAGVVTSKNFKQARKFVFSLLIPLSVVLAVAIGPSIAIALTPTLGDFNDGWAVAWINATEEQIFPSNIDLDVFAGYGCDTGNCSKYGCSTGDCVDYGWETALTVAQSSLASTVMYNTQQGSLAMTPDDSLDLLHREIRWNTSDGLSDVSFKTDLFSLSATATIPSEIVAWSLNHLAKQSYSIKLWPTGDQNFTTKSRQPIVTASCGQAEWLDSITLHTTFKNNSDQYILQSDSFRNLTIYPYAGGHFGWVFLDHDQLIHQGPSKLNPSVWVLSRYWSGDVTTNFDEGYAAWGLCAIQVGYSNVRTTVTSSRNTFLVGNKLISSQTDNVSASSIPIPARWLNRTLPTLDTLVENGLGDLDMATFLATSLAISMAEWPVLVLALPEEPDAYPDEIIVGNPTVNDSGYINPSLQWRGPSKADHVFYPGSEYVDTKDKYRLRMDVSTHGYGYHINQTSKVISISVLAAYCLYVLIFLVLMLTFNRVHSNAWDSIGELTALAIMSRPDYRLRNTSAGVETVALYKLPMNIRANDNNHLEIVFGDDEGSPRSGVVEKDKEYE